MNKLPLPLKGLVFLILCTLLAAACRTIKHTENVHVAVSKTDSTRNDSLKIVVRSDSSAHELIIKDSAIGISGGQVSFLLDELSEDTIVKKGNITAHAYRDSKGKRHVECTADSLTIVISNVTRERDFFKHGFDSICNTSVFNTRDIDSSSTTLKEVEAIERTGFWERIKEGLYSLLLYLIAAVIGAAGWELIRRLVLTRNR